MYCPKCGVQNADEAKYCRACGADLSNVLAVIEAKPWQVSPVSEKYVELYSAGVRGLLLAAGFFIVSGVSWMLSPAALVITLFAMAFAFMMLATGISRFVQARGLKALKSQSDRPILSTPEQVQLKPRSSIYDTDDLVVPSVTERTTRHLGEKR